MVRYRKEPPSGQARVIEYLTPKTDWGVSQAEIISVAPEDRAEINSRGVSAALRAALRGEQPLTVWKERFWGSPRDVKLIDRLSLFPRLRDLARQPQDNAKALDCRARVPAGAARRISTQEQTSPVAECRFVIPSRRAAKRSTCLCWNPIVPCDRCSIPMAPPTPYSHRIFSGPSCACDAWDESSLRRLRRSYSVTLCKYFMVPRRTGTS